jgi:serine/threonine protein kinase
MEHIASGGYSHIYSCDGFAVKSLICLYDLCILSVETSAILTLKGTPGVLEISNIHSTELEFRMKLFPMTLHERFAPIRFGRDEIVFGKTADEALAKNIILQLLVILYNAHSKSIIHCDIKPANIVIDDDNNIALIDWGLARFNNAYTYDRSDLIQTAMFRSPEAVTNDYDERLDIYTVGLIYCFITGNEEIFNSHYDVEPTNALEDLLFGMLKQDYKQRLNVVQCLNHPYFGAKVYPDMNKHMLKTYRIITDKKHFVSKEIFELAMLTVEGVADHKSIALTGLMIFNHMMNKIPVNEGKVNLLLASSCYAAARLFRKHLKIDLHSDVERVYRIIYRKFEHNLYFLTPITAFRFLSKHYNLKCEPSTIDKLLRSILRPTFYELGPIEIAVADFLYISANASKCKYCCTISMTIVSRSIDHTRNNWFCDYFNYRIGE